MRRSRNSPGRQAAVAGRRCSAPFGWFRHHVHLDRLLVQGQCRLESKVGVNTSVEWPVGIGAKGNEGVANNVMNTKGSIGYVEYAYAKQNKLTTVNMINKDGETVAPNSAAFQAAAASANWQKADGFYVILTQQPGAALGRLPAQPLS